MTGNCGGGPQAIAALENPCATATVSTISASSFPEN